MPAFADDIEMRYGEFIMLDIFSDIQFALLKPQEQPIEHHSSINLIRKTETGPQYQVHMNGKRYWCYLGEKGISSAKKEGDKATPAGDFGLKKVLFRSDRIHPSELKTKLPTQAIRPNDGWCDDPSLPEYNKPVKLPFKGSHEKLWLDVNYYDLIIVTDYNMHPAVPGKGSAIFIHIKDRNSRGCLGFTKKDLLEIINHADKSTRLKITSAGDIQFYQKSQK